jgi:protein-tyrosine-phosphatase/diadenosine tetraphosphate (Ap4A) HIT family hydrolase
MRRNIMDKRSILFVCTGNTFRSVVAEYLFKKYLSDNDISGWKVGSAGIEARPQQINPLLIKTLEKHDIDISSHKQRKLTPGILKEYDIIVAMAEEHLRFIRDNFNCRYVLLFNDLAEHKKTSILDVHEEVKDYKTNKNEVIKKYERTIKEIARKTPLLFKKAYERFYLFTDFVNENTTHRNGFPVIKLHETKNTMCFMSIDIPSEENGHLLVVPKRRYMDFSDIPNKTLAELSYSIKKIGKAIIKNYAGYNVLLNNGIDAGQYIFHTHFHIIPRNHKDGLRFENWDRRKLSQEEFVRLNKKFRKQIQGL